MMPEIDLTNDEDEEFIGLAGMEAVIGVVIDLTNDDDTEVDENGDIGHANGEADAVVAPLDVVVIDDVPAPAQRYLRWISRDVRRRGRCLTTPLMKMAATVVPHRNSFVVASSRWTT